MPIDHERDPRGTPEFDTLLAEFVEELNLNGFVDPEEVLAQHPDIKHDRDSAQREQQHADRAGEPEIGNAHDRMHGVKNPNHQDLDLARHADQRDDVENFD